MSRHYTMTATIPVGDGEAECRIVFSHVAEAAPVLWGDAPDPGWPESVDLQAVEPAHLWDAAAAWLAGPYGYGEALEHVASEEEGAAEYAREGRHG